LESTDSVQAFLVGLLALSLAALPLAGGMALAMSHDTVLTAPQGDCCHDGEPCEKGMNDCGSSAGCVFRCFQLAGSQAMPFAVIRTASTLKQAPFIPLDLRAPSENPPLPPPRT
jgi:hypothetical protein